MKAKLLRGLSVAAVMAAGAVLAWGSRPAVSQFVSGFVIPASNMSLVSALNASGSADTAGCRPGSGDTCTFNGGTYVKNVPLTGFSLTFGNQQTDLLINPAGTLATGTVTMAPAPFDGQRACLFTTQTVTSLTVSANTSQTINNAVTTLSANGKVCYVFSSSNTTWDRAQ